MVELIIGPSTGWLYDQNMFNLAEQEKFLETSGASVVELCTALIPERLGPFLMELKPRFWDMGFRTIHLAADVNSNYPIEQQASFARDVLRKQKLDYAVIHPDTANTEYYKQTTDMGGALAIENMDKDKESGFIIKKLEKLLNQYNLGFVFDVQHAWEHDPNMGYARELFSMAKNSLVYLHVSGQTQTSNHVLVYMADNKDSVLNFTSQILSIRNVPIILEGDYKNPTDLKTEIDFLTKELS